MDALNDKDLENISRALDQMAFRCARNRRLAADVVNATDDADARTELAVLSVSLKSCLQTHEKISELQRAKREHPFFPEI